MRLKNVIGTRFLISFQMEFEEKLYTIIHIILIMLTLDITGYSNVYLITIYPLW